MKKGVIIVLFLVLIMFSACSKSEEDEEIISDFKIVSVNAYEWVGILQLYRDTDVDYMVIDLRPYEDFSNEKVKGAVHMDYYSKDFEERVALLDKDTVYFLYSEKGVISFKVLGIMNQLEFKEVYHLQSGVKSIDEIGYRLNQIG